MALSCNSRETFQDFWDPKRDQPKLARSTQHFFPMFNTLFSGCYGAVLQLQGDASSINMNVLPPHSIPNPRT
jgi:hypothetical protein